VPAIAGQETNQRQLQMKRILSAALVALTAGCAKGPCYPGAPCRFTISDKFSPEEKAQIVQALDDWRVLTDYQFEPVITSGSYDVLIYAEPVSRPQYGYGDILGQWKTADHSITIYQASMDVACPKRKDGNCTRVVMNHEIGHCLGLKHNDTDGIWTIMNSVSNNSTWFSKLDYLQCKELGWCDREVYPHR